MNLLQSNRSYEDLIQDMRDSGYSECYIGHIQKEIRWISKQQFGEQFTSYSDVCRIRSNQTDSMEMKQKYRVIYGLFSRYASGGSALSEKRNPLYSRGACIGLNPYYTALLEFYKKASILKGLKEGTYRASISACSGLLAYFQKNGHTTLDTVNESDVLDYFTDENGNVRLSSSTKINIASVFSADLGEWTSAARRILTYLPSLKKRRKTIQYLTEEEILTIQKVLADQGEQLSLRDKAIGTLLYFTGMRSSDIAALQFNNIDWEQEQIQIVQMKTGNPLSLPLPVPVGNALFDYINIERPVSSLPQIFLTRTFPVRRIESGTVGNVANRIYLAAGIRQQQGDRKGAHLFRHHLATALTGTGIALPVISATLGHANPNSLDHYLFADIKYLRECALSIENYPVREGVFQV